MTLADRLSLLVSAIGVDIKSLRGRMTAIESSTVSDPYMPIVNAATRLIQTQRITAQIVLRGQLSCPLKPQLTL